MQILRKNINGGEMIVNVRGADARIHVGRSAIKNDLPYCSLRS